MGTRCPTTPRRPPPAPRPSRRRTRVPLPRTEPAGRGARPGRLRGGRRPSRCSVGPTPAPPGAAPRPPAGPERSARTGAVGRSRWLPGPPRQPGPPDSSAPPPPPVSPPPPASRLPPQSQSPPLPPPPVRRPPRPADRRPPRPPPHRCPRRSPGSPSPRPPAVRPPSPSPRSAPRPRSRHRAAARWPPPLATRATRLAPTAPAVVPFPWHHRAGGGRRAGIMSRRCGKPTGGGQLPHPYELPLRTCGAHNSPPTPFSVDRRAPRAKGGARTADRSATAGVAGSRALPGHRAAVRPHLDRPRHRPLDRAG